MISKTFVLPALLGLLILLHLFTLERYPAPFVDEGWYASRAWESLQTGKAFGPLDRGVFDRFPGHWTFFPWLPNFLQSLFLRFSDSPQLFPLRLLSMISGIALLYAIFCIGKRLGGSSAGWFAAMIAALSHSFFYSAHLARYDILVAAFGFGAIALALNNGTSFLPHFLSGLVVGAAFETHPNGAIFGPVILALYFLNQPVFRIFLKDHRMWLYVAGVISGLLIYVLLHIVRFPETWTAVNRIAAGGTHLPPFLQPSDILDSFQGFLRLSWMATPYLLLLSIPALVWFCTHSTKENKIALLLLLGVPLVHILLIRHKILYYTILYTPALCLGISIFFFQIQQAPFRSTISKIAVNTVVIVLLICSGLQSLVLLRWNWKEDFVKVQNELQRHIKPGETIMGNQLWWLTFPTHEYLSWEGLYYYRKYKPDATFEDAFREFHPKVFILDLHVETFIQKTSGKSYSEQMGIPAEEFRRVILQHGRVRAQFDGGYYGNIHVIEMRW